MHTIAVSEFRANLLNILKKIEHGDTVTITSHGKPVARVLPPEDNEKNARDRLNEIGRKAIIGDIVSPIEENWESGT